MNIFNVCKNINNGKLFINLNSKAEFLKNVEVIFKSSRNSPKTFFYIYLGSMFYAFKDEKFLTSLKKADFIYLDGFLVGLVIKFLYSKEADIFPPDYYFDELLSLCSKYHQRVILLGATDKVSAKAVNNLKDKFPELFIRGIQGYVKDSELVLKKINNYKADLLIVGLGLGKQERWILDNKDSLSKVKIILPVGNYINILGGENKLPPDFITTLKLRWLYRLAGNPLRLGPRYFFGLFFLILIIAYSLVSRLNKPATS